MAEVCRGCGAPVLWVRTASGRAMPCEPEVVRVWRAAPVWRPRTAGRAWITLVTSEGQVVYGERGIGIEASGPESVEGYRPHWAVCPEAGRFRRGVVG